jgi:hypothetical protein
MNETDPARVPKPARFSAAHGERACFDSDSQASLLNNEVQVAVL